MDQVNKRRCKSFGSKAQDRVREEEEDLEQLEGVEVLSSSSQSISNASNHNVVFSKDEDVDDKRC